MRRWQQSVWLAAALALAATAGAAARQRDLWIALFNGKDLTGWHLRVPTAHNGWSVDHGLLVNQTPSTDLVSDQKFQDFEIHYEYMYPPGSNSGVYLRGRYEIQIQDDYGKAPESHINGAIYGLVTPRSNPTKPAGQWQTVDARIKGNQATVVLNGVHIINHAPLAHPTGGALDDQVGEPGPIMLQGDHGPITFRNLRVRPIGG